MICPRCGHDQPDTTECHACGIVIAKYRSAGPTKLQAPTTGAGADVTADPEPSRQEQTIRLFLASVAVSWASIIILLWGAREAGAGMLALSIVPLAATFVVWTRIGESIPEPAVRKRIVLAGVWSIGGWFALLIPALFLFALVAYAAMGETGSEAPRMAMIALAGGLLLIVVGLVNTWYCSSRVIRQGGPAPSVMATGATVALGLTVSIALPPLVAAYRRHQEAEELETRPAREAAALAALQDQCDRGVTEACYELAEGLERGRYGRDWDAPRELALYARSCELGSPKWPQGAGPTGCVKAGVMCQAGDQVPIDLARAYALYDRGCTLGNLEACYHLGEVLVAGQGAPRDAVRAAPILERACGIPSSPGFQAQNAPACASLGKLYLDGDGVVKDLWHARTLFQLACDSSDGMGCYELGRLYHRGLGVRKDLLKAEALYDRACTLVSDGVDKNGCNAVEQECRGELPRLCSSVAKAIYVNDEPRAAALHRRACEAGLAQACSSAARRYETGGFPTRLDSPKAPTDLPLARALYERGCELDEKDPACANVLRLDVDACTQAHADACLRAAHWYETARQEGTAGGSLYSAARFYTRACAIDPRSPACEDVGRLCKWAGEAGHWQDVSEFCSSDNVAARPR
jgi:TPR repeat protein